ERHPVKPANGVLSSHPPACPRLARIRRAAVRHQFQPDVIRIKNLQHLFIKAEPPLPHLHLVLAQPLAPEIQRPRRHTERRRRRLRRPHPPPPPPRPREERHRRSSAANLVAIIQVITLR